MLQIRSTLFLVVLAISPSVAISAQTVGITGGALSISTDDQILNAPYSAQRQFTEVKTLADGSTSRTESGGAEARDSQGRTYSAGERQWTYMEGNKSVLKSEMLCKIHDPIANTETRWNSTSKEATVIHGPPNDPKDKASAAECHACDEANRDAFGDAVEKLGIKTIGGIVTEGTRSSYTVSAGQTHDKPVVVVHERWYSPDLRIVILETNDDPRSGSTRNELVHIIRGDPDFGQYHPPANYVVHEFHWPPASQSGSANSDLPPASKPN